jgi:hypothetical protein
MVQKLPNSSGRYLILIVFYVIDVYGKPFTFTDLVL